MNTQTKSTTAIVQIDLNLPLITPQAEGFKGRNARSQLKPHKIGFPHITARSPYAKKIADKQAMFAKKNKGAQSVPIIDTPWITKFHKKHMENEEPAEYINVEEALPKEEPNPSTADILEIPNFDSEDEIIQTQDSTSIYKIENFTGIPALKNFHKIYRTAGRVDERIQDYGKKYGKAGIEYLSQIHKLRLAPEPIGLVRRNANSSVPKEHTEHIAIGQFAMGDKYAQALSASLRSMPRLHVHALELSQNRLTNKGALAILSNIPPNIQKLDLSKNNLTTPSYRVIAKIISTYNSEVRELVLEKNNGGDVGCRMIAEAVAGSYKMSYLNLSTNNISDYGAQYLGKMLDENNSLLALMLHWNKIKGTGAIHLAQALLQNDSLQIFDASFNNFGITINNESAKIWKKMFNENTTLIHLDLSHNSFKLDDCVLMTEGLQNNHTLLGIHMLGNETKVDSMGFLNPQRHMNPGVSHIFSRIEKTLDTGKNYNKQKHKLEAFSNCWICEGWTQIRFEFIPGVTSRHKVGKYDNVYVHLSFEDYQPDLLEEDFQAEEPGTRFSLRMVPPGSLNFFYSLNEDGFTDAMQPTKLKRKCAQTTVNLGEKGEVRVMVPRTNIKDNVIKSKQLITKTYLQNMKCIPRAPPKIPKFLQRVKTPWSLPISIFWGYIPDNESILVKCFEFDWSNTRIPKFIKDPNELASVKDILRKSYKNIRESYKYYSSVDPYNGIFAIGMNVCTDIFSNKCHLLDEKFNLKDIDLDFIQTNSEKSTNPRNPDRALIRFKLLEMITRVAMRKFHTGGLVETPSQAIEAMMKKHYNPAFCALDSHKWRAEKLWNEPCDLILKKHRSLLKKLFNKYSGRHALPGNPEYVSLEEFLQMVTDSGCVDDSLGPREINILYNQSMMTQVDELKKDRHLQMFQMEFHEALCRVAEKLSIPSPYSNDYNSKEELGVQPLEIKIKHFLETLLKRTMKKEYIANYEKKVMKGERRSTLSIPESMGQRRKSRRGSRKESRKSSMVNTSLRKDSDNYSTRKDSEIAIIQ